MRWARYVVRRPMCSIDHEGAWPRHRVGRRTDRTWLALGLCVPLAGSRERLSAQHRGICLKERQRDLNAVFSLSCLGRPAFFAHSGYRKFNVRRLTEDRSPRPSAMRRRLAQVLAALRYDLSWRFARPGAFRQRFEQAIANLPQGICLYAPDDLLERVKQELLQSL